jgi:hypothetical protein
LFFDGAEIGVGMNEISNISRLRRVRLNGHGVSPTKISLMEKACLS